MQDIERILTDADVKLLHEVDNGSGSKIYCRCECRSTHTSHIHFTCTSCGKTFCIKDIDTSSIPLPEGFTIEETNCVMKGICPDCTVKATSRHFQNRM